MGNKKEVDDFQTPMEMLTDIMAQVYYQQAQLENLADLLLGENATGFVPFEEIEPKRQRLFRNRAKKKLNRLLIPMFSFMMYPTTVQEVKPGPLAPAKEARITEKLQAEEITIEDLSPERVDAELLPECHENSTFYSEKTTVLS